MAASVIAAFAGAAAVSLIPGPPAHEAGQCADNMAGNLQAYYACISDASARCTESGGAFPHTLGIVRGHITCVYPDESRDERDYNGIPGYGDGTCDNFPASYLRERGAGCGGGDDAGPNALVFRNLTHYLIRSFLHSGALHQLVNAISNTKSHFTMIGCRDGC